MLPRPTDWFADTLKSLRKIEAGKGFLVLKKTLMRENRRSAIESLGAIALVISPLPRPEEPALAGVSRDSLAPITRWGTARPVAPEAAIA